MMQTESFWTAAEIIGLVMLIVAISIPASKRVLGDLVAGRRIRIAFIVLGVAGGLLASFRLWIKYL